MQLDVLNINGEKTGRSIQLPDAVFGVEANEHVVYLEVKRYLNSQRQGTHKAKERNEISGSSKKLFKQKGTGGARRGNIKSPLLRGGGRVFGPQPRDYDTKLNRKTKALARRVALSSKAAANSIIVLENFDFEAPKTKRFEQLLKALQIDGRSLLLTGDLNKNVYLSARNLEKTEVSTASGVNTYSILLANKLILTEGAVEQLTTILDK